MLVIDGKYSNEDGTSTGRMQQTCIISILGRHCRATSIRSEEIVQRMFGGKTLQSNLNKIRRDRAEDVWHVS